MTDIAADVDIVAILVGDEAECHVNACSLPAAWAMRCPGCHIDRHLCVPHRAAFEQDMARLGPFVCTRSGPCRTILRPPLPWRPI